MAEIFKLPQPRRKPHASRERPDDEVIIARCRELADNSIGLTGNGVDGSPDWALLDICATALSFLAVANQALANRATFYESDDYTDPLTQGEREEVERLWRKAQLARGSMKPLLSRARKIRAKTGAGIFAKALLVRDARTAAPYLAKSLAEDLIAQPALRASLWPAPKEDGSNQSPAP